MKIAIVGCGGVAGYLALPLVKYFGNINKDYILVNEKNSIVFVDGDRFEPKNLSRQVCSEDAYGVNKARWLGSFCRLFSPSTLGIEIMDDYVKKDNIDSCLKGVEIVLLCVDNNKTRKLVDSWCKRNTVILINGGNELYDGNVQFCGKGTQSLSDVHKEIDEPGDKSPGDSCDRIIDVSPQICITNNMVASLMLVQLFRCLEDKTFKILKNNELYFDINVGEVAGYDRREVKHRKKKRGRPRKKLVEVD